MYVPKKENTCGIEGEITLTSFRNTVNTKIIPIAVARKEQQFPPNFNAPDDGRVGRNSSAVTNFKRINF
jgi:hypothetical protein